MPCNNSGQGEPNYYSDSDVERVLDKRLAQIKNAAFTKAALCAIMTVLEKNPEYGRRILSLIDWNEAGVTKDDLLAWWTDHMEDDRVRSVSERTTPTTDTTKPDKYKTVL